MKTIHFPPEPNWDAAKSAAISEFEKYRWPCRLVISHHWASEGYWIEFEPFKPLDLMDYALKYKPSREEEK